jgi:hypothetical protein
MWFKADDGLHDHPKAIAAGPAAMGLWLLAGTWSARHGTDGYVPDRVLPRLCDEAEANASRLLRSGLWERAADGAGYVFHDWLDYQPAAEQVRAKRRQQSEAGRKGGQVSGHVRRRRTARHDQSAEANHEANASATATATAEPNPQAKTNPVPSRSASPYGEAGRARTHARGPSPADEHPLPADWEVTPDMVEWARSEAPDVDGRRATAKFRNYYGARPRVRCADWAAEWRTWMLREQEFADRRPPSRDPTPFHSEADRTVARLLSECGQDPPANGHAVPFALPEADA